MTASAAVDNLEVVVAYGRTGLGKKQHVAIAHTGHGDAVATGQQLPRNVAITADDFAVLFFGEDLTGPLFVLLLPYPERMAF